MKPSSQPVNNLDESQRIARLRDNKRRSRQRQKDYTSSLESKLREFQSQGVQATQEVQVSAREVVEDNTRLKALLRHVGVADHVIETWTPNTVLQLPEKPSNCEKKCTGTFKEESSIGMDSAALLTVPTRVKELAISQPNASLHHNEPLIDKSDRKPIECPSLIAQTPPCKILTRLAENPTLDVTQPSIESENSGDTDSGGVECSKAHNMLIRYATTEEKLDVISKALEEGCVEKAGGGCKVRNVAIWKAIDDVT